MLELIISLLKLTFQNKKYTSQVYGLASFVEKDDKRFPAAYNSKDNYDNIQLEDSAIYFRQTSTESQTQNEDDGESGCDELVTINYPLTAVAYVPKSIFKTDNAFIDNKVSRNIANIIENADYEQLRVAMKADDLRCIVRSVNVDRYEIWKREFSNIKMNARHDHVLCAVNFDVEIKVNSSCLENFECDDISVVIEDNEIVVSIRDQQAWHRNGDEIGEDAEFGSTNDFGYYFIVNGVRYWLMNTNGHLVPQQPNSAIGSAGSPVTDIWVTNLHYTNLDPPIAPGTVWGTITGTLSDQLDLQAALDAKEEILTFSGPLSRAGNIISIPTATTLVNGYLTAADWNTFNNKQNALGFTPENVANKATDFSTVNNTLYPTVQAAKTYMDGLVVGLLDDRGNWDASGGLYPNTNGSGPAGAILKGDIWYISVAGTLGVTPVLVGYSVRALADAPGQTAAKWDILQVGLGYVPENVANKSTDGTLSSNSDTLYPSQKAVKTYVDNQTHNPVTIGAPANGLSMAAGQILTIGLASAGVTGALSGTDWSTFNNKINLTSLSATSPIFYDSATGVISSQAAGAAVSGYVTPGAQTFGGDKSINGDLTLNGASISRMTINAAGSNGSYLTYSRGGVVKWNLFNDAGGSDAFRLDSASTNNIILATQGGNVGIGVSPTVKFQVGGQARATSMNITNAGDATFTWNGTNNASWANAQSNGDFIIGSSTANTEGLLIGRMGSSAAGSPRNTIHFDKNGQILFRTGSAASALALTIDASQIATFVSNVFAAGLGVGVASLNASALFQVDSTTKGVLLSRGTNAQKLAISSPADGLEFTVTDDDANFGKWIYRADTTTWLQL